MARVSCWTDGPSREVLIDTEDEQGNSGQWWGRLRVIGSTCLLPEDHAGEHEFTPDDAISVTFLDGAEAEVRCQACGLNPPRYANGVLCQSCFDRICEEEIERLSAEADHTPELDGRRWMEYPDTGGTP